MRYLAYFFLIIINFIFQTTFLQNIAIFGIKPNMNVILIVSFSFLRGQLDGAFLGFFSGLLIDIFFGNFIGLNTFIGFTTGYLSGRFHSGFYQRNVRIPFLLTLGFTIFYELLFFVINILLKGYPNIFHFLTKTILIEAIYTALISIIIYKILYRVNIILRKTDRSKRRFIQD